MTLKMKKLLNMIIMETMLNMQKKKMKNLLKIGRLVMMMMTP